MMSLPDFIQSLKILDTHEHLAGCEADYLELKKDILQDILCSYIQSDLISAGMSAAEMKRALDVRLTLPERWNLVSPFWEYVRFTGYGQMASEGIQDLLDAQLGRDSILEINERYHHLMNDHPYQRIIKEKCGINLALLDKIVPHPDLGIVTNILDSDHPVDADFFRCVYHLDNFIFPQVYNEIRFLEQRQNQSISCLNDWVSCCYMCIQNAIQKGVVGFKLALAYKRSLNFPYVARAEAERDFQDIIRNRKDISWEPMAMQVSEKVQNYLLHEILEFVRESRLPIQIHTGLQAGNANFIGNANPLLLNDLFVQYPEVNFILLHTSIPFTKEASLLVKMYPNVFMDASWVHVISPQDIIIAMQEWAEMLPVNKIMAFGGDLSSLICLYGHQKIARINLMRAFELILNKGVLSMKDAEAIVSSWLTTNPKTIFNLSV